MQQGIDPIKSMLLVEQIKTDDRKMSHHPISLVEAKKNTKIRRDNLCGRGFIRGGTHQAFFGPQKRLHPWEFTSIS